MIFDSKQNIKVTFENGRQVWISKHSKQIEYDLAKQYGSKIKSITGLKSSSKKETKKKGKSGRAWQKDHHNYNKAEKHEVKPEDRKKPARNVPQKKKGGKIDGTHRFKVTLPSGHVRHVDAKDENDAIDQTKRAYRLLYGNMPKSKFTAEKIDVKRKGGVIGVGSIVDFKYGRDEDRTGQIMTEVDKDNWSIWSGRGLGTRVSMIPKKDVIGIAKSKVKRGFFEQGGAVSGALPSQYEIREAFAAGKLINPQTGKKVTDREEMYRIAYLSDLAANPSKYAFKDGGEVPKKRKRRTKAEMMQARYEELVDTYKYFIVDLDRNRAIDGYEFKEDAVETMEGDIGKYPKEQKTHKIMSLRQLKTAGIDDPRERWKGEGKEFGLGGIIMPLLTLYIGYKIGRFRPQKQSFDTEKRIAKKSAAAASKAGKAISKKAGELAEKAAKKKAATSMGKGGKTEKNPAGVPANFVKAAETKDFIYYQDMEESDDNANTVMIRKSDMSVASDNYFATNAMYEDWTDGNFTWEHESIAKYNPDGTERKK